ncbi:MAG: UDP-N-acetylglucosamine 1-carboxyvinyltransferase [Oscillospiraceae bacterium]|nr:UDP-N-acetylglucosamine 1-carboxyvinyltransferase [Oscillospiraceae bacterium]
MELWHVRGGRKLCGGVSVQGSKNAALPILAAAAVTPARIELSRVPELSDVEATLRILRLLGCRADFGGGTAVIDSTGMNSCTIPPEWMEKMRSSVFFMGALLARFGEAVLSLPGGCRLGRRPIDLHLSAMRQLGAEIEEYGREIRCRAGKLYGAEITLPFPSVGATENVMLAACGAEGETLLHGAAREPEIVALQDFLRLLGAEIEGAGTGTIRIGGMRAQRSASFRIPADRIAAATLACAAAAAGGTVWVRDCDPKQISAVLHFLNLSGCDIIIRENAFRIRSEGRLKTVGEVVTAPYPGFPTDAQPLLIAALLRSDGLTRIRETIFENRFRYTAELNKLGADVRLEGQTAAVRGVPRLHASLLRAGDLRGGAALILASLGAEGESLILDEGYIKRGYEKLDAELSSLGACVWRESFD